MLGMIWNCENSERENKYQDEAEKNVEISQWLSDNSKKNDLSFPLMSVGTTTRI